MPLNKQTKPQYGQSAGGTEYTDCISAEEIDSPHKKCPKYDIK